MAFGQPSGPPAGYKQLEELLELLNKAGFESFKEARYPMDFTQRQAGGKFTRDEADEYIAKLQEQTEMEGDSIAPVEPAEKPKQRVTKSKPMVTKRAKPSPQQALSRFSAEDLAAELQRRGWIVAEG